MANENTDFLRFSAYSIKDLITRKLSQDSNFTDQIYEGSNLAILIDLVSYMYQCLMYALNNAAAESMFSDTSVYENINRLVHLIGYSPKGIIPSTAYFYINNKEDNLQTGGKYSDKTILKYTAIDTGKIDQNGSTVYYSTKADFKVTDDVNYKFKMYNGRWKHYTPQVASGIPYETFVLAGLKSSIEDKAFVANDGIDVYVEDPETGNISQYDVTDQELFTNNDITDISLYSEIYSKNKEICAVRLNGNKQFEIKFGDGIIGKKLKENSIIHIFYLETNGLDGHIDFGSYTGESFSTHSAAFFGINNNLYKKIFGDANTNNNITNVAEKKDSPKVYLESVSTDAQAEESVESIKLNAPQWFKIGNRLITHNDYIYYLKNRYSDSIADVVCQNNWEYISTFFKWLYQLGKSKHNNSAYYLRQAQLLRNNYVYADSADANNIYLWTKLYAGDLKVVKNNYIEDIQKIKTLTSELVFLEPIDVKFALCAAPEDVALSYLHESSVFDIDGETYLEVTVSDNTIYVSAQIQNQIEKLIIDYFSIKNLQLGMTINYNDLINQILSINGVLTIKTVWVSKDDPNAINPIIYNGLCFASWSNTYIEAGDDLNISNSTQTLQQFQFPSLYTKSLANKIKLVKKSINNINTIQY